MQHPNKTAITQVMIDHLRTLPQPVPHSRVLQELPNMWKKLEAAGLVTGMSYAAFVQHAYNQYEMAKMFS